MMKYSIQHKLEMKFFLRVALCLLGELCVIAITQRFTKEKN